MHTKRLTAADRALASRLFAVMAEVFEEDCEQLSDAYIDRLLGRADFWAIAAFMGEKLVGGITAHMVPMTRTESAEIFIYDIAVRDEYQRKGVGRHLLMALQEGAAAIGISEVFVLADNDDIHALDFYRALGGVATPVTLFTFSTS